MRLLALMILALFIGAVGSGFFVKGIVFNLGVLAGIEIARWVTRRQKRIKSVGQIRVSLNNGSEIDLVGVFSYYNSHWEFKSDYSGSLFFSYDQGATWERAQRQ